MAAMENARYMKRRIKPTGKIDADFAERTLVVHYEIEASVLNDSGHAMRTERKLHRKNVHIQALSEHSDTARLAWEIVQRNDLIPENCFDRVQSLLEQLQEYDLEHKHRASSQHDLAKERRRRRKREKEQEAEQARKEAEEKQRREASVSLDALPDYMEQLYEDSLDAKVEATGKILALAQKVGNLEALVTNDALVNGLARTLKEDYKKKMDLCLNIMGVFLSFSHFSQMHEVVVGANIGDMALRIMDLELRRHDMRLQELQTMHAAYQARQRGEDPMRVLEESGEGSGEDEPGEGNGRASRRSGKLSSKIMRMDDNTIEKERHKLRAIMKRQDRLLHVCLRVLLNLAEDLRVEKRLVKKKLILQCVKMLGRQSADLIALTLTMLRKLSIFQENARAMLNNDVVQACARFVPCPKDELTVLALRLLFNLSFMGHACDQIIRAGLLPQIVNLLKKGAARALCLKLLYHISIDDNSKSTMSYTDAVPLLLKLIHSFPQRHVAKELGALAVNLSLHERNAELLASADGLRVMVGRAVKTQDPVLLRVAHNLSRWTYAQQEALEPGDKYGYRGLWAPFVPHFYKLLVTTDQQDVLVEVAGTLANFTPLDLPRGTSLREIAAEYGVAELLRNYLVPNFAEDDTVMHVVMLIGALALDPDCAPLLAGSRLPVLLHDVLRAKQDDLEVMLQVLHTTCRLLRHKDTAEDLAYGTELVADLCRCLHHEQQRVQDLSTAALDLAGDFDRVHGSGKLWTMARDELFEIHNRDWLDLVAGSDEGDDSFDRGDLKESQGEEPPSMADSMNDSGAWRVQAGHENLAMDLSALEASDEAMGSPQPGRSDWESRDDLIGAPRAWDTGSPSGSASFSYGR